MSKEIRIAVVGAGMMGGLHIEAIRRIPGLKVVALADTNHELADKYSAQLAVDGCYYDYLEMFEKEKPDSVHVCTPNFAHYEVCKAALERGINVYCEKPLTNTFEQAENLRKLAERSGVVCAVDFNYRHNAVVREMHERILSENWGKTFLLRGEYLQDWMMYDSDYNWRCVPELGGASRTVADIGSHCFDTAQYILGEKIVKVYAKLLTALPQRKKFTAQGKSFETQTGDNFEWVDIATEDAGVIMAEFESGALGVFEVSQISAGYKNGLKISVDGSAYSMTWEQENADKLFLGSRERGKEMLYAASGGMTGDANRYANLPGGHAVAWSDALKNAIREYYNYIADGGAKNFADFEDGARIVKITEACLESGKTGRWIDIG